MTTLGGFLEGNNTQQHHFTQLKDGISADYFKNPQILKVEVQFLFD